MLNIIKLSLLSKGETKAFICVFLISVLSLLSLIQANVLYVDDIGRVLTGYPLWENDGRPLSSYASTVLQIGKPLTDISPLSQILCLAFYSLSSIYLGKIFKVDNLVFLSLGGIIFVLNPFNLQIFAYVFDSFTIGLAALSSTAAFFITSITLETSITLDKTLSKVQNIILYSLILSLLVASLCFYQMAIAIYIAAFTFYSLFKLVKEATIRESVKGFLFSTAMLFSSLVAYIPIKNFYVKYEYTKSKSQIPALADIPETFIRNLLFSVNFVSQSLGSGKLKLLMLILGISMILCLILLIYKNCYRNINRSSNLINLLIIVCLTLFYCFFLIVSFCGVNLIFINPPTAPRYFMGFSVVVGISCFFLSYLSYLSKLLKYCLIFFLCLLCLSFANVSLTFGNVLHYQDSQEEIIATILLSDLEETISNLSSPPEKIKISIADGFQHSSLTSVAFYKYPILRRITPSISQTSHNKAKLIGLGLNFDFKDIKEVFPNEEKFVPSSQPILSRRIYEIYLENNDTFVIRFKRFK